MPNSCKIAIGVAGLAASARLILGSLRNCNAATTSGLIDAFAATMRAITTCDAFASSNSFSQGVASSAARESKESISWDFNVFLGGLFIYHWILKALRTRFSRSTVYCCILETCPKGNDAEFTPPAETTQSTLRAGGLSGNSPYPSVR